MSDPEVVSETRESVVCSLFEKQYTTTKGGVLMQSSISALQHASMEDQELAQAHDYMLVLLTVQTGCDDVGEVFIVLAEYQPIELYRVVNMHSTTNLLNGPKRLTRKQIQVFATALKNWYMAGRILLLPMYIEDQCLDLLSGRVSIDTYPFHT